MKLLLLLFSSLYVVSTTVGHVSWQRAQKHRGPHHLEAMEPFVTDVELLDDYLSENGYNDGSRDVYDYDWLPKSGRNMGNVDPPWRRIHGIEDPSFGSRQSPAVNNRRSRARSGRIGDVQLNGRPSGRRGSRQRRPGHHRNPPHNSRGGSGRAGIRIGGRLSQIMRNQRSRIADWMRLSTRLGISDWDMNFGFDFDVEFSSSTDWWRGPNVCKNEQKTTERKENPTKSFFITKINRCQDKGNGYVCESTIECGKWKNTSVVTYSCCSGFSHRQGELGCQEEVELKNILEVLKDLKLDEFRKALGIVGLNKSLTNATLTLFVPPDEKLKEYTDENNLLINNLVVISEETENEAVHTVETVLNHIIPKKELLSHHMTDDMVIDSALPGSRIRINKNPRTGVITANCVKLSSVDNLASNGIIHTVEDIIPPIGKSAMDLLESTGNHQKFIKVLASSKWNETLDTDNDAYTIIAPTDSAFNNLNLEQVLSKCLGDYFVRSHLIKDSVCPSVVSESDAFKNLNDKGITITKDADKNLFLSGVKVTASHAVTNGVVLVVDKVLGTERLSPLRLAESEGAKDIVDLIKKAELTEYVDSLENATIFFPTDSAVMQEPKEVINSLIKNKEELKDILKYHIVKGQHDYRKIKHARHLPSMSGNTSLAVSPGNQWFARKPLVQCAQLVKRNLKTCSNVSVFLVDKVLYPPKGNLLDTLAADPQFAKFVTLLKKADLHRHLQSDQHTTVLAPTNKALERFLSRSHDKRSLKEFVKSHIIRGIHCCRSNAFLSPLSGISLNFRHDAAGDVRVVSPQGVASVRACDQAATNGIIHVVEPTIREADPFPSFPDIDFMSDYDDMDIFDYI